MNRPRRARTVWEVSFEFFNGFGGNLRSLGEVRRTEGCLPVPVKKTGRKKPASVKRPEKVPMKKRRNTVWVLYQPSLFSYGASGKTPNGFFVFCIVGFSVGRCRGCENEP